MFIGENGCDKSNILEVIALASAAGDDKLDNEFLASRGIRVTEPQFMRSAFEIDNLVKDLKIDVKGKDELAKKHDKQVIFTTHNPAVLDGLDLDDDEQRLFVIYRNQLGHTKARRILKPEPLQGQEPVKLSEAFLMGYIGGLPNDF